MKIKKSFGKVVQTAMQTLKLYPVEMGLAVYTFVIGVFLIDNLVSMPNEENIMLVPLFLALAYLLNNLFPKRLRAANEQRRQARIDDTKTAIDKIYAKQVQTQKEQEQHQAKVTLGKGLLGGKTRLLYYLCWLPILPLWLVDMSGWIPESAEFVVAIGLALATILVARRSRNNHQFAAEAMKYLLNLLVTVLFVSIAYGLLNAIYYSFTYIFGLPSGYKFAMYSALFSYSLIAPIMFLSFVEYNINRPLSKDKFIDVLLNYIITPAVIIYTIILYLYFIKIVVKWELPEGGVAYMVFAFTVLAVIVKAAQPLLGKRYYDWFFDRFSLIAAPAVVMFWIGLGYRVNEYGFTALRVYLLVAGIVMTVVLIMFSGKNKGRYLAATLFAMGLFALVTYIPPISAENIAHYSQYRRVVHFAKSLNILDEQGKFKRTDLQQIGERIASDSIAGETLINLNESMYYLSTKHFSKLGVESQMDYHKIYGEISSMVYESRQEYYNYNEENAYIYRGDIVALDISRFSKLVKPSGYNKDKAGSFHYVMANDTLIIYENIALLDGEVETEIVELNMSNRPPTMSIKAERVEEERELMVEVERDVSTRSVIFYKIKLEDLLRQQYRVLGVDLDRHTGVLPTEKDLENNSDKFMRYDTPMYTILFRYIYIINTTTTPSISDVSIEYILLP